MFGNADPNTGVEVVTLVIVAGVFRDVQLGHLSEAKCSEKIPSILAPIKLHPFCWGTGGVLVENEKRWDRADIFGEYSGLTREKVDPQGNQDQF